MAKLSVTPQYLEKLAVQLDDAAKAAEEAAGAASGITTAVWVTHGVISGVSNGAISGAEGVRADAGKNIYNAASDLAAKLRAAKQVYEAVDEDLAGTLQTQMHTQD